MGAILHTRAPWLFFGKQFRNIKNGADRTRMSDSKGNKFDNIK